MLKIHVSSQFPDPTPLKKDNSFSKAILSFHTNLSFHTLSLRNSKSYTVNVITMYKVFRWGQSQCLAQKQVQKNYNSVPWAVLTVFFFSLSLYIYHVFADSVKKVNFCLQPSENTFVILERNMMYIYSKVFLISNVFKNCIFTQASYIHPVMKTRNLSFLVIFQ